MRWVVFGFEPFGDEPVNPSGEAARSLHGLRVHGITVDAVVLPVTWSGAFPALAARLGDDVQGVLGLGQGKGQFAVETLGRNVCGDRPDNLGMLKHGPVVAGGDAVLNASWPSEHVLAAVASTLPPVPVVLSRSAGDYLCNHTLYATLHHVQGRIPAGFLHVPKLAECSQDAINRAVEAALLACVQASGRGVA